MTLRARGHCLAAVLLLDFVLAAQTFAHDTPTTSPATAPTTVPSTHVSDPAGFFSADAVARAEERLAMLDHTSGIVVHVETFDVPPPEIAWVIDHGNKSAFPTYAESRLKDGVCDVYVMVDRHPAYLDISTTHAVTTQTLPAGARQLIVDDTFKLLKEKQYDAALGLIVDRLSR